MEEKDIEDILNEVIQRYLIPKFQELGMPATGEWEQNIEARGSSIWGRDYTEQLVEGREPGRMPPPQALEAWVTAKLGISDPRQVRQVSWAVAKKIAAQGTSWYERGGSDLLEILSSDEVVSFINERLGVFIVKEITESFQREMRAVLT